jgi:LruC domain-containing protein
MKLNKLWLAFTASIVVLSSCRKDEPDSSGFGAVSTTDEMKVPAGFNYSTTKTVYFNFSAETVWGKEKMRLDLYDFNPTAKGEILTSRFLNGHGKVNGTLEVPTGVKELYSVLNYPDGSSVLARVEIAGNVAQHKFGSKKNTRKTIITSPDCTTGCGTSVNNNTGWYNADAGGVYCFTGTTSGGINARSGSTVRICGTGSFQISVESNAKVEIVDGANVTITNLSLNSSAEKLTVYPNATLSVSNWATPNADIINYGTVNFVNLGINTGSTITNNGDMSVTGTGWYTVNGGLVNNGSFTVAGNLTQNSNGAITNNCSMVVAKQLKLDATFINNSYVSVEGTLYLNSNGKMTLNDGAMVVAEDVYMDGTIEGINSTSLVKVNDQTTGNSSAKIKGNLEYCDANGVESGFYGSFVAPATQSCNVYIPTSPCNPDGNGTPNVVDSDFDGVSDNMDMYPNDPNLSGATFYPSDSTYATLMFEDLWPGKGDFDFNDLVMGYSHKLVTNSNNMVVRVESRLVVRAIGGSLKNGFGFQFDIAPSEISSVTGQIITRNIVSLASNGAENNQSKATIIAFDNAYSTIQGSSGTYVNTINTEPARQADTVEVITTFTNPQTIESLGAGPFNPFIFINGDRGRELHLVDNPPTDLVKTKFFQSSSDDSDPSVGRYYKSAEGHPWALNIKGDVKYMQEKLDIVTGYHLFATWAQSGGTQAADWYLDHSGYRDGSKLY